ncbi:two component sigma54-specific transcriptional regulator, Fis family [Desulfuromonas soudanensis]|uniref:Two component sigma54-specific transcriptional regulator, Fis family n=1 Tax=Desulfuromonas soudanensis TaxID=1603606 RepID=A0A0M3QF23_9BACT|nr:sigma-54 dependent transcriptional regulator [Desulfuromonas soudanensis]ALC15469.1 two component sigma54-specific transcriptional regulator, Fis family [Desulfuromonas soudanensis]
MSKVLYPALPVLLVDDEPAWLRSMTISLARHAGINNVVALSDPREVAPFLEEHRVALALIDYTMPHVSGEELLELFGRNYPEVPVIILTGRDQAETAVRCMKLGAFDYYVKTVEDERLLAGIQRALRLGELQQENLRLQEGYMTGELASPEAFSGLITRSDRLLKICKYVEAIAASRQPVLVTGESGTGKELIARILHKLGSPQGPWVAVDVAGLDDDMFADTLFGHVKGAFTGAEQPRKGLVEEAAGGVLFLDEIGSLSQSSQLKLLRLIQDGEYRPVGGDRTRRSEMRIVAATNQDLGRLQETGGLRRDLYYRLRTHHVHLPALRQRPEDIPVLLDFFLGEAAREFHKNKPTPPPELDILLSTYHFPGNVRELRAMVYDAVSTHRTRKLSMDAFKRAMGREEGRELSGMVEAGVEAAQGERVVAFPQELPSIRELTSQLIAEASRRSGGNQSIMAGMLGISRPALNKRLKKLDDEDEF